jgi:hypothetical protein
MIILLVIIIIFLFLIVKIDKTAWQAGVLQGYGVAKYPNNKHFEKAKTFLKSENALQE